MIYAYILSQWAYVAHDTSLCTSPEPVPVSLNKRYLRGCRMEYVEKDRMPTSDSKLKEMVRKASEVTSLHILLLCMPLCKGATLAGSLHI